MYQVLKYIHDHIDQKLQISDLAAQFHYSKCHFCVKFRQYTGSSVTEYIRHYRMQLAALDILTGRKALDVACAYGYDSLSGFNRAFLTEYGCLPREYKKNKKESQLYYERRKMSMIPLTDRCTLLKEQVMNERNFESQYHYQRNVYGVLGIADAKEAGHDHMRAISCGLSNVLNRFRPFIAPYELITGFNFGEIGWWDEVNDTEEGREKLRLCGISEDEMNRFFQVKDCYVSMVPFSFKDVPKAKLTKTEQDSQSEWAAIGRCIDANHTVLQYEKVLKLGFSGILKEIEAWEQKNGTNSLYEGTKEICRAACNMGEKYAQKAKELIGHEDYNDEDLEKIITVCSRVPKYPATNLHEAIQSLWFAHILNTWEDIINANSLGRLDQILYPYYQKDLEEGRLTKEEAFELICCLWLKLYRDYDVQQSCVGGTNPDGTSAVNDLSYMMLDATEQLNFIRCLSVRFSKHTEKKFLKRALEVVGHVQKGVPFFFNDDVMIPSLIDKGISREDAYDYTQIGCVETVIPGKSNPHAVTGETNLLKAIEYVFCNGRSMMYPEMETGVKTGELSAFKTFEDFYKAVLLQIEHILRLACSCVEKERQVSVLKTPRPVKSMLTEGCLETGRDFNDAGARYDYYQIMLGGIPNLADSLAAIQKLVYEEKKYTLEELKEILIQDFPDEAVRLEFINKAPKFGNDIDEVDQIASDVTHKACDILEALSRQYGLSFHAQPFTFLWMIDHGSHSAASPDGRHKGEAIAYSVSPMQGRDFKGLTAVFHSICKLPAYRTPGTTSAIIEVDPKLFHDSNIGILTDLLVSAGQKGLGNVQFNTVDAETLIDAQKHPEKHRNLAVRVSGFSQKFNLLETELQNHIIERTKHACL